MSYAVQLPYYFSQYYNDYAQISHQMSIGGQDMIVGYNSPVLSLSLIGKPFVWGYILFGNAYGISWYFLSRNDSDGDGFDRDVPHPDEKQILFPFLVPLS